MPLYNEISGGIRSGSTGDYRIDSLLFGIKWDRPEITYSFPEANALWWADRPSFQDFQPLSQADRDVVRQAMATWAQYIALPVVEVADGVSVGDLRVMRGWGNSPIQSAGNYPNNGPEAGDVGYASNIFMEAGPGSYDWMVVLHEIGHALGLKHPQDNWPNLPAGEDDMSHTLMSYQGYPSYFPTTPMVYDIAAVQFMYGANYSYHAGDDTYTFDDAHPYDETIWDGGGNDTIRYTGTQSGYISLAPGNGSQVGREVHSPTQRVANVWIAFGTTIENGAMGSGNDFLVGNDVANVLDGGDGNDQLNGAGGDDTLIGGNGSDVFEFALWDTGSDLIEDFTAQDRVQLDGGALPSTMTPGDGTGVGRFEAQYEGAGGITTLFIGTNTTPGAEVTIRFKGDFAPSQFAMSGGNITLQAVAGQAIAGTPAWDMLTGTPGNDTVDAGGGIDTFMLPGAHSSYAIAGRDAQATVSGPQGTDVLANVERVRFEDGYGIALDVNGHAGQAYRLYQAAFERQPDLPGLGYQMNDLDIGYSLSQVAANFIASPEFQSKYGPVPVDTDFITLLYEHVLHRQPEAAGLQWHLDELAHGYSRADVLTFFSESPENQANVIGQIANGMLYVPLV